MKRKIIQLEETAACTLALCDDGTVFKLTPRDYTYDWVELPPLPEAPINRSYIGATDKVTEGEKEYAEGYFDAEKGLPYSNPYSTATIGTSRQYALYKAGWERCSKVKLC